MHFSSVAFTLGLASSVSAHATMWGVSVNGVDQGDGRKTYIRSPPNNSPIKDLTSPSLACNVNGAKATTMFVKAAAGDKLTFEWFHDNRDDDIIAASHLGPIITYIAPFTTGDGTGAIWTKIAEDGYDSATKLWAVDKIRSNHGKTDFILPSSLAAGEYLIRQEIIALHESDSMYNVEPARGAQFYPSCVQVQVGGSGSAVPDQNFDFNTGYTYTDPGIHFNLYSAYSSYIIPGPAVWTGVAVSGGASSKAPLASPATTSSSLSSASPSTSSSPANAVVAEIPTTTTTAAPTTLATLFRQTTMTTSSSSLFTNRIQSSPTRFPGRPSRPAQTSLSATRCSKHKSRSTAY